MDTNQWTNSIINGLKRGQEVDSQILDKYNKEINDTRVTVSGIVRKSRNFEFDMAKDLNKKCPRVGQNCFSF